MIKPRKMQVLVRPEGEQSNVSESGLITPSTVEQEQRAVGEILAVGQGIDDLNVGDNVIYGAYAGERISTREGDEDVEYILLHDEDVLATVTE